MFWIRHFVRASIIVIAAASTTGALANSIVVRSNGPSAGIYPPGKTLAVGSKIALKTGDTVTVLDAGGTHILLGPGMVAVSGTNQVAGSGISQLISNIGVRQSRTGATRGVNGVAIARSPNVWYIDASRSGMFCVVDPQKLALWRPNSSHAATFTIARMRDGKSATVAYRAGQSVAAWPTKDLLVAEGDQYQISGSDMSTTIAVKTTLIGTAPSGLDGTAAALLDKGCSNQLNLLADASMQTDQ